MELTAGLAAIGRIALAALRATRPVIGLDPHGQVREIRYSDMSMQPVRLPAAQIRAFYAAYRAFAEIAGRRELTLTLRLRPGECLIADNTRILAGRTAFADTAQRRVQVCWADIDGIASSLALSLRPYRNGDIRRRGCPCSLPLIITDPRSVMQPCLAPKGSHKLTAPTAIRWRAVHGGSDTQLDDPCRRTPTRPSSRSGRRSCCGEHRRSARRHRPGCER